MTEPKGIADGQHHVAHFELVTVGQRDGGKFFGLDFQHRQIRARIGADDLRIVFRFAVGQRDLQAVGVRAFDDVIIREDVAILRDDHTRTLAFLPTTTRPVWAGLEVFAEEPPESRILHKRITRLPRAGGIDCDDAGSHAFDNGRVTDAAGGAIHGAVGHRRL